MDTPYNAGNRKVVNFKDFIQNKDEEKEELKDIKRSFSKNDAEVGIQQHKYKYNKVTHKLDDLVEDEVDDKLDAIEQDGMVKEDKCWLPPQHDNKLKALALRSDDIGDLATIIQALREEIGSKASSYNPKDGM